MSSRFRNKPPGHFIKVNVNYFSCWMSRSSPVALHLSSIYRPIKFELDKTINETCFKMSGEEFRWSESHYNWPREIQHVIHGEIYHNQTLDVTNIRVLIVFLTLKLFRTKKLLRVNVFREFQIKLWNSPFSVNHKLNNLITNNK